MSNDINTTIVCYAATLLHLLAYCAVDTMKRSSPWKNLQQTFTSTPINKVKRVKSRTTVDSLNSSKDRSTEFRIEDSDEENVPCGKSLQTPLKTSKPVQSKSKPVKSLLINTSINSSILDSSLVLDSDSGDSLDREQELIDVSEYKSFKRQTKARSKSLLFLTDEQNQHNSSTERITLKDVTQQIKQQQPNHTNVLNNTFSSRTDNDDTVIESDSVDEDEPSKKSTQNERVERITRQHSADIVFTQSTESSAAVIESGSSQFSLKFESPNPLLQRRRTKSKKIMKDGLLDHLNKVLNNNKSDYSFWMNERTSNLIEPGRKMRIDKMENLYGRILLHCSRVDENVDSNIVNILCIDPSFKKLPMLHIGKTIEVGIDSNQYSTGNNTYFYPQVTKILL